MKRKVDSFWITNISKKNVSLSDLNFHIYSMRSVNLLDKKHHSYTREQLEKSKESGSLYIREKQKLISIRLVPPEIERRKYIQIEEGAVFQTKQRSAIQLENIQYEELNVSDDTFAEENAETAEKDHLGRWNNKI